MNNLAITVYDVDFGDCILVQFPDGDRVFSMVIDCGSDSAVKRKVKPAWAKIKEKLPSEGDKKHLDLLVVTHPHLDHIKGFDPKYIEDIRIDHIWLSCFMDQNHPSAQQSFALQALAEKAAKSLHLRCIAKNSMLETLVINSLNKENALKALKETIPAKNDIEPIYISRNLAEPGLGLIDEEKKSKYKLSYNNSTTCFSDFEESDTVLRVLSPEYDIDGYYLGKEDFDYSSMIPFYALDRKNKIRTKEGEDVFVLPEPSNVSKRDFRALCNSLYYSALSFIQYDNDLTNNTSIVLLLEWRGQRLLFTGDAEYKGGSIKKDRRNMNWDVMLETLKDENYFSSPLNFLKVAHHGSINGTPFIDEKGVNQTVLNDILPKGGDAKIVVSTKEGEHGTINEVPYLNLMEELGLRCKNHKTYYEEDRETIQPQRTDKDGTINIKISPAASWNSE